MKTTIRILLALALLAFALPVALAAERYEANWESIDSRPVPCLVAGCQVRHLHPLGALQRPGLRLGVVSPQDV